MIAIISWFGWCVKCVGMIFLFIGLAIIIRDLSGAMIADEAVDMELLSQTWFSISANTLSVLQSGIESGHYVWPSKEMFETFIKWPTAYALFGSGTFLFLIGFILNMK